MSKIKIDKVVSSLPSTLIANTVYAVRVGTGFDLYITDNTGATAHQLNSSGGTTPWVTDTNGITYTAGNVGIGASSQANTDLRVGGFARFNGDVRLDADVQCAGGDLIVSNSIKDVNSATGTSGQILSSEGAGGGVEWIDAPSGGGAQLLSYNFSANHNTNDTGKYYQFKNQNDSTMYDRRATFTNWGGVYNVDLVAPDDCYLKSFTIRSRNGSTWSSGLQIKMRIHKNISTREYDGSFVTSTGSGNDGQITFDLTSSDTSFSQGDAVSIGFNCTGVMGYVTAMAVFELT